MCAKVFNGIVIAKVIVYIRRHAIRNHARLTARYDSRSREGLKLQNKRRFRVIDLLGSMCKGLQEHSKLNF